MTALATSLGRELAALAARVQSDSLLPWQLERIRAALAPELAILARCDEHQHDHFRCRFCAATFADLGALADHGRAAHSRGLDGRVILRIAGGAA